MKLGCLFLFVMLAMVRVEARTLDINSEKVAGYFIVTGGPSALKKSAFLDENTTGTTYSSEVANNYSGEFGFLYSLSSASLRFGFEILRPSALKDVIATSGGTDIYSLNSEVTAYMPKLGLEINLQKTATYRAFIQAYAGSANISYKNDYTILSYAGQSDHSVEGKQSAMLYGGTIGVESLLTDTTTYIFEFGYRQLKGDSLKYSKDVTTFQGSKTAGGAITDVGGKARTLDFTGGYISLGFRFYL